MVWKNPKRWRIASLSLSDLDQDQLSDYRAAKIGFIFQFFNLIPELTAEENISIPMRIIGMNRKESGQRAEQLLDLVGLRDRRGHRPSQLSGGEQQRVAIATALANDPPLILADEPTGELDTEAGTHILDLLGKLAHEEGKTVVVVTHDIRVARYADRVLRILDGKITAEQEARELAELSRAASEREEVEKLRDRVAELTDTLTRIRQSLTKA
jgi:putative ABC transport system ATP-binding protein